MSNSRRDGVSTHEVAGNGLLHRRTLLGRGIMVAGAMGAGSAGLLTGAAAEPLAEAPWSLEPGEVTPDSIGVSHGVHGPSDVTEVLELFDRRYRDLRGEDDPYSSQDPDYPQGRLDQL